MAEPQPAFLAWIYWCSYSQPHDYVWLFFFNDKQLGLHKWEERMNVSANVPLINVLFYFLLPLANAEAIMLFSKPCWREREALSVNGVQGWNRQLLADFQSFTNQIADMHLQRRQHCKRRVLMAG